MAPKGGGAALQTRDLDILTGLFECRVMTLRHIGELYFLGKREAAKKRVQRLKRAGYVIERQRRRGEHSILHIGKRAFAALQNSGRLAAFPEIKATAFEKRAQVSSLTLQHELEVMDVRVAIFRAVKQRPSLNIEEFTTWPALCQFIAGHTDEAGHHREVAVKPDGFIRIQEETSAGVAERRFFIEVDRSTESLEIVAKKVACYLDFYRSGGMALRFGGTREAYKAFPFRVLVVCTSESRRIHLARRLLRNNPPALTHVWLATIANCRTNFFGAIWIRPRDLLDQEPASPCSKYRRASQEFCLL